MTSLWGEEFEVKEPDKKKILEKVSKPKVQKERTTSQKLKSKVVSIDEKIELIKEDVYKTLGSFKDEVITIRDYDEFKRYIDKSIENGIIAIDTETNNTLNTFDCKLMGLCLYTPGLKAAYIPVNHINRLTNEKLENQITESQIKEQLDRLSDTKIIFHNASFDIEVIMTTCGVKLKTYWDTQVGSQLLDENELKGLKIQYKIHIDPEQDKYDIEHLFKGLPYEIFDPELFAMYAATDSLLTYRLYEYQLKEFEKEENKEIYDLLRDIEIPIIDVIVDMELTGIKVDLDYAEKMSKIFHKRSDEIQKEIDEELEKLEPKISAWKLTPEANRRQIGRTGKEGKSKSEQLADPIDLGSPTQLSILLYDILKVPVVDKKTPRGTGSEILEELSKSVDICKIMLKKRGVDILINTFIDAIPTFVQKDGKVHPRFNSTGTQTGRFSSTTPNLQQIPSHEKTIRLIFEADPGYLLIGSDYSAQEPRSTASLANDKDMLEAYDQGKDLYAVIGSKCFHNRYEDNLEFDPTTGEIQPDGKARRAQAKAILLGITYGMSAHSLAERINVSQEEAESIIDNFYKGFKGVKKLTDESQQMLKEKGYVTDMWGRRRHLPDAQLPEYEVKPNESYVNKYNFNPLLDTSEHIDEGLELKINHYKSLLSKARWKKDIDELIRKAERDGLEVKSNRGFINRSLRQCLNARIQGTAASMTKQAMIMIHNDEELNRLGFKLLCTIHDEVFGMAPTENADQAARRLCDVMVEAAKKKCSCKFKCDPYVVKKWYCDEASAGVLNDFNKLKSKESESAALRDIKVKYEMFNEDVVERMCKEEFDPKEDI